MVNSHDSEHETKATRRYVQWVGDVRAKVRRGWRYSVVKGDIYIWYLWGYVITYLEDHPI